MKNSLIDKINEAVSFILAKVQPLKPQVGIILGSGLGELAESVKEKIVLPYSEIPNMPKSTVSGHKGNFVFGKLEDKPVMVMQGRVHFYEGYTLQEVTFPVRVMQKIGVKFLILTSAVGAITGRLPLKPADIVLVKDHINFLGDNPLRGQHYDEFGERFPDMSEVYSSELRTIAKKVASRLKIKVYEGVYLANRGPSYETPAEIKAFKKLGADVVGMSVVPEAIVANQARIKVLAIAYISNLAAGISKKALSHEEVLEVANVVGVKVNKLIKEIVRKL
ncbi:MAG: purine-nucleoside phosphorylase [Endomicrobia bacterium]|nr:purine-nucleoside phosphorylase [Endomicrobiia bacterium]MDW8056451.1 purine-nucleoside phosphorylase [Elusimicrobiota bacterium]